MDNFACAGGGEAGGVAARKTIQEMMQSQLDASNRQIGSMRQQLEAAKQRELELLAVIENIKDAIYRAEIRSGMLRIMEEFNIEPSQALSEHEAKLVAEYKQRAEAAEAKLRELIPIARIDALSSTKPTVGLISALNDYSPIIGDLLYSKPFPAHKQEEK